MKNLRAFAIIDYLKKKKYCSITELMEHFHVSSATIHRDIASLAEKNAIRKVRGGIAYYDPAEASDKMTVLSSSFQERINRNQKLKQKISEQAFSRIRSLTESHGSCVEFEDSGTVVLSSLRNLLSFASFPPEQRDLQTTLTLCAILGGISAATDEESTRRRGYSPRVRKAMDYIEENYMFSISTEDVARVAGVHVGHLHRIFPEETGMWIGEYLTHLRIERAKTLLMHTDIPSASIATRIGISSQQYFCRLFKKETGMSPQEYRKSYELTCHYDPQFYPAPIIGTEAEMGGGEA